MSQAEKACLHPDLELMLHKGSTKLILAAIEVKPPKAFP
jgi:hypothetical protein